MITYDDAKNIMNMVFAECQALRDAGQKEYAHSVDNALRNFEQTAADTGITREQVLFIFMKKHIDGISAYIKGHKSQRESVTGRINDSIVYLCLLRCMVEENNYARGLELLNEVEERIQ